MGIYIYIKKNNKKKEAKSASKSSICQKCFIHQRSPDLIISLRSCHHLRVRVMRTAASMAVRPATLFSGEHSNVLVSQSQSQLVSLTSKPTAIDPVLDVTVAPETTGQFAKSQAVSLPVGLQPAFGSTFSPSRVMLARYSDALAMSDRRASAFTE